MPGKNDEIDHPDFSGAGTWMISVLGIVISGLERPQVGDVGKIHPVFGPKLGSSQSRLEID
jgi:hypothetical protein